MPNGNTNSLMLNLPQSYTCCVRSPHLGSLPGVSSLRLIQAGFFSLSVGWDQPSSAVQGYRLTYGPRGQAHTHTSVSIPCLFLSIFPFLSASLLTCVFVFL